MAKTTGNIPKATTNVTNADYLQNLSQRVYNLIQIIRTHCKDPVEIDKELMNLYSAERYDLAALLSKQPSDLNFSFNASALIPGLISNHYDTRQTRFRIDIAKDKLGDLLAEIQNKRVRPAITGVEDGPLKDYLDRLHKNKDRLTNENILRTQKAPEIRIDIGSLLDKKEKETIKPKNDQLDPDDEPKKEPIISDIIKKKFKDIKFDSKGGKGRLQLTKGGEWIDVGGYKTRTYNLIKYILQPSSKSKLVIDVYECIRIKKDSNRSDLQDDTSRTYDLKKEIIENTVDELQKSKFLGGHIRKPIFNDEKKTVIFDFG